MRTLSAEQARHIALNAQGFGEPRPKKVTIEHVRAIARRLHLIQIDSVNVCVRAHYMPFFSRLGPYKREWLEQLAYHEQYLFEQWAHEACYIPLEDYPLFRHQMERGRRWSARDVAPERLEYFAAILDEVRERGPVITGEMDGAGGQKGWWGWSHAKVALEYQFAHGRLAVRERRNFARVYDLAERVFPPEVVATGHAREDAHRQMVRNSLQALGVATAKDLADYYRLKVADVKAVLPALIEAGDAEPVRVETWKDTAYLAAGADDSAPGHATAILSPFDNLIWDRQRTERVFGFHYRIEIYTPAPKRVYGYYVLPVLHEGRIVARVDLKANRQSGVLQVKAAHLESGAAPVRTARALAKELRTMARWLGLPSIEVSPAGSLAGPLTSVLA